MITILRKRLWVSMLVLLSSVAFADEDSQVTIRRSQVGSSLDPDYRVESGTAEIAGEPVAGLKESYASWKQACEAWKKEMKEMNGNTLMAVQCGTPKAERDSSSSRVTQSSQGSYKLRVRIRESR